MSLAASPTSNTGSGLAIKYRSTGGRWDITLAGTGAAVTTITPDNALRLQSFQQDFAETAGVPTNDLTNTFTYNPAHQVEILDQSNTLYNYTAALNRTGSYEPNGLNQYEKVDGQTLEYDATGNLIKDRAASGALTSYTYDMENHLVAVTGAASGTLRYDVLGRLSKLVTSSGTTQFHYDGDALVGEYLNGSLHRRYVHGDQVDEPLIEYQGTNLATRRYLHADHQGSIIAHSTTLGAVTQTNAYDPYGIPRPDDETIAGNQGNEGRFGYTGQAWIKELGLNYYKARIYAPRLGRFLQTDPIFYADDMNIYVYARNDPFNRADWNGRKSHAPWSVRPVILKSGPYAGSWTVVTASRGYRVVVPESTTNGANDASKAHKFDVEAVAPDESGNISGDQNTVSIESEGAVYNGNVEATAEVIGDTSDVPNTNNSADSTATEREFSIEDLAPGEEPGKPAIEPTMDAPPLDLKPPELPNL